MTDSLVAVDVNNPTGRSGLVAIDKRGCRAFFLDPHSYEALDELPLPARPHEVAISADHGLAYVSIYGNGIYGNNTLPGSTIVVLDLAARAHVGTLDVSPYLAPHGLAFGSRRLRASPSLKAVHKFFGSRRLRASPQGSSPWTSLVLRLGHPTHHGPRWRGHEVISVQCLPWGWCGSCATRRHNRRPATHRIGTAAMAKKTTWVGCLKRSASEVQGEEPWGDARRRRLPKNLVTSSLRATAKKLVQCPDDC